MLITTDASMENMHRKEISRSYSLAILATAHNSPEDIMEWVEGLVKIMPVVNRNNFRKRQRPWFAAFSRQGHFTVGPHIVTEAKPLKDQDARPKGKGARIQTR